MNEIMVLPNPCGLEDISFYRKVEQRYFMDQNVISMMNNDCSVLKLNFQCHHSTVDTKEIELSEHIT